MVATRARMLVFRSVALGLLGACFLLIALRRPCELRVVQAPPRPQVAPPASSAAILDVAAGVDPSQLGALVHLGAGEHVVAVDDRRVSGDLEAGAMLAELAPHSGDYVDLTVAGRRGVRRVIVLLH